MLASTTGNNGCYPKSPCVHGRFPSCRQLPCASQSRKPSGEESAIRLAREILLCRPRSTNALVRIQLSLGVEMCAKVYILIFYLPTESRRKKEHIMNPRIKDNQELQMMYLSSFEVHWDLVENVPWFVHRIMQTSKMQNLARQVGQGTWLESQVSGCCWSCRLANHFPMQVRHHMGRQ